MGDAPSPDMGGVRLPASKPKAGMVGSLPSRRPTHLLPVTVRKKEEAQVQSSLHSLVTTMVVVLVMAMLLLSLANFRDTGRQNLCLRAQISRLQKETALLKRFTRTMIPRALMERLSEVTDSQLAPFQPRAVEEHHHWYSVSVTWLLVSPGNPDHRMSGEDLAIWRMARDLVTSIFDNEDVTEEEDREVAEELKVNKDDLKV